MALRIDGRGHPFEVVCVERSDVAGHHGAQFLVLGYRYARDRHLGGIVRDALLAGRSVEVCANGMVLPCIGQYPAAETLLPAEPLLIDLDSPKLRAVIESWGHFSVSGGAAVGKAAPAD